MVVSEAQESKRAEEERVARLVARVAGRGVRQGGGLATAESCTGGWIAKCLTDLPGSSEWYRGGVVSYSNEVKTRALGVSGGLIAAHGAVSQAVARAMAEGALQACAADRAVAVTGIAGPAGGSADKPVGTVWLAWAAHGEPTRTLVRRFDGDREAVRRAAVICALEGLLDGE